MKAWRFVALALVILAGIIIARSSSSSSEDVEGMIEHNCALFYGPLGPDAQRDCRIQMRRRHNLPVTEGEQGTVGPTDRFQN